MLEVEYKAAVRDLEAVRSLLTARGATPLGLETQQDAYYAHPVRDFATTDEALRIRTTTRDGKAHRILTYKGVRHPGPTRSREEVEVSFDGALDRVLEALSFRLAGRVEKRRELFRMPEGLMVTLDQVEGLGTFVEVETLAEPAQLDAARQQVLDLCSALGLGPEETRSYLEMVLERQRGS